MYRMCASNSHSYTHLILALGIVREPTVWVFITSKYPGTRVIGLPNCLLARLQLFYTLLIVIFLLITAFSFILLGMYAYDEYAYAPPSPSSCLPPPHSSCH